MSTNRSSSTVRNLRAMFEGNDVNAERPSSTTSERSSRGEGESRVSKIRASFVSVERPAELGSTNGENGTPAMNESTVGTQQTHDTNSPSEGGLDGQQDAEPVSHAEQDDKKTTDLVDASKPPAETPVEASTNETHRPSTPETNKGEEVEADVEAKAQAPPTEAISAVKPEESVPAVGENSDPPKTTESTNHNATSAVSSPQPKSVSKKASKTSFAPTAAPTASTTGTPAKGGREQTPSKLKTIATKPSLNLRQSRLGDSPATKIASPKSPRRPTTSDSKSSETSHKPATPSKASSRPARSSLTAQTASSTSRSKGVSEGTNGTDAASKGLPIRTKPKSPTKPVKLSSHLTAPTASFSAKHESSKGPTKTTNATKTTTTSTARASLGDVKSSAHSTTKSSLARSNSTATKPAPRTAKPVHAGEGFLARMTRPTASSASRSHDKPEPKAAAAKSSAPSRSRAGTGTGADSKSKTPVRKADKEKEKKPTVNGHAKGTDEAPQPSANGAKESTPAPEESTVLDSSMAAIPTPGLAEDVLR